MVELEDLGVYLVAEMSFPCFHSLMTLNSQTKGKDKQSQQYNLQMEINAFLKGKKH